MIPEANRSVAAVVAVVLLRRLPPSLGSTRANARSGGTDTEQGFLYLLVPFVCGVVVFFCHHVLKKIKYLILIVTTALALGAILISIGT